MGAITWRFAAVALSALGVLVSARARPTHQNDARDGNHDGANEGADVAPDSTRQSDAILAACITIADLGVSLCPMGPTGSALQISVTTAVKTDDGSTTPPTPAIACAPMKAGSTPAVCAVFASSITIDAGVTLSGFSALGPSCLPPTRSISKARSMSRATSAATSARRRRTRSAAMERIRAATAVDKAAATRRRPGTVAMATAAALTPAASGRRARDQRARRRLSGQQRRWRRDGWRRRWRDVAGDAAADGRQLRPDRRVGCCWPRRDQPASTAVVAAVPGGLIAITAGTLVP